MKIVSTDGSVLFEDDLPEIINTLESAVRRGSHLPGADLRGADLRGADLRGADLRGADLRGAYLGDAYLRDAYLRDAYLRGADLGGADLGGANLRDANLGGAYLRDANLGDAYLRGANLGGADLGGANLRDAYLRGANLGGADLGGANLRDANLRGANGLNPNLAQPLLMLLDQPGPIRAYKLVTADGMSPLHWQKLEYKIGTTVETSNAVTDINDLCAAGINVATLDWCMREWQTGWRILILEFTAADIAAIPTASDGKFRLHRCTVVGEKDLGEIGLVTT